MIEQNELDYQMKNSLWKKLGKMEFLPQIIFGLIGIKKQNT